MFGQLIMIIFNIIKDTLQPGKLLLVPQNMN